MPASTGSPGGGVGGGGGGASCEKATEAFNNTTALNIILCRLFFMGVKI
ncbi:hypothetical protein FSS13T_25030 [Flavobacterium saliperosum S13]|uniref:Uncharacterized protein n=2 Tax=Flavobacterium saliperosum TaxID=329186 RepID=A0A1G4W6J3_9FLAO|nr:hypothetical protein [Flavobacterium saliperosum]ESU23052.1 hypothetical protein FSS13T_25030 [Flavobacterium saliperosum S13]SCX17512.1 hypothetical protein SAMN02927925_02520 [Flavobacterium saliperosum]